MAGARFVELWIISISAPKIDAFDNPGTTVPLLTGFTKGAYSRHTCSNEDFDHCPPGLKCHSHCLGRGTKLIDLQMSPNRELLAIHRRMACI